MMRPSRSSSHGSGSMHSRKSGNERERERDVEALPVTSSSSVMLLAAEKGSAVDQDDENHGRAQPVAPGSSVTVSSVATVANANAFAPLTGAGDSGSLLSASVPSARPSLASIQALAPTPTRSIANSVATRDTMDQRDSNPKDHTDHHSDSRWLPPPPATTIFIPHAASTSAQKSLNQNHRVSLVPVPDPVISTVAVDPPTLKSIARSATANPSARRSIAVTNVQYLTGVETATQSSNVPPSPKMVASLASLRASTYQSQQNPYIAAYSGNSSQASSSQQHFYNPNNSEANRMSFHGRSLTMSNSAQLPTPAPNMFYQQQQQLINPQYRQYDPTSPTLAPQSPVYSPPPSLSRQHQQQAQQANYAQPASRYQPSAATPTPPSQAPPSLKLPLSPEITVQYYRELLTTYELHEVYQYPHVYFAGAMGIDKVGTPRRRTGAVGMPKEGLTKEDMENVYNNGYDDSRGDYFITPHDHIGYRYELISILGKGSFGQAAKCFDHKTKEIVALKIIKNKKRFEKQGVVEVKILDRLRKEDADKTHNLVHMLDSFYFRGHLCISFELLGNSLYDWVKAGGFRGIHMGVLKVFSVQLLECLSLLSRIKAVHCDLKPENILFNDVNFLHPQKCDLVPSSASGLSRSYIDPNFNPSSPLYKVKVIDFGSSCYEHERIYTYIQSRFYRSPEVILGIGYTVAIDMWSFGCILAELLTGYPLFPGENEQEQLACIMEIKGVPPDYVISRGNRRKYFFEQSTGQPRPFVSSKGKKRRPSSKTLSHVLRTTDMLFLDFLDRCLEWDPERRMTPDQALRHEWLAGVSQVASEAKSTRAVDSRLAASSSSSLVGAGLSQNGGGSSVVGLTSTARSSMVSPNGPKYSFGEIMSHAIGSRRRELSLSSGSAKKVQQQHQAATLSASMHASGSNDSPSGSHGEPSSSWRSSFVNWRRIGSISGPSSNGRPAAHVSSGDAVSTVVSSVAPSAVGETKRLSDLDMRRMNSRDKMAATSAPSASPATIVAPVSVSSGLAAAPHLDAPLPALPLDADPAMTSSTIVYGTGKGVTSSPATISSATASAYVAPLQKEKPRRLSMFTFQLGGKDRDTHTRSNTTKKAIPSSLSVPLSPATLQQPLLSVPTTALQNSQGAASSVHSEETLEIPAKSAPLENVVIDVLGSRAGSTLTANSRKSAEKDAAGGVSGGKAVSFGSSSVVGSSVGGGVSGGVDISVAKSMSLNKIGGLVRSMSQRKTK